MWITYIYLVFLVFTARAASQNLVYHTINAFQHVECIGVICDAGSQLSFCKRNKTADYCHRCPIGSSQPIRVDSSKVRAKQEIPKCLPIDIDCPPEAVRILENGKTIGCKCDTFRGYAGSDFMLCQKYPKCPPGMSFGSQDGKCTPCPDGYFNPQWSYESCTPHSNCTLYNRETVLAGNTTMDTVCGELLETRAVTYHATTTHVVLQFNEISGLSDVHRKTVQSDVVEDETPKIPPDRLVIESGGHTNRMLTFAVLFMGVSLCVLAVLLTVVVCKLQKRTEGLRNAKTNIRIKDVKTGERLIKEGGNDKTGIQAEDDCKPRVTPVTTVNDDNDAMDWIGEVEPGTLTIYPQINVTPCAPTAPPVTPSLDI